MDNARLELYLRLRLADGIGAVLFHRMVEAFGGIEGVWSASSTQWMSVKGVGNKLAAAIAAVTDEDVQTELAEAQKRNVTVITDQDDDYPPGLKHLLDDRPPVLYVRGELEATDAVALAVVGSRRCTHYGREQAERFSQLFARAGFTVISGGARGIDTAAHRAAATADGRTIVVMGCGLGTVYPPENTEFFDRIVSRRQGAIISELPMRTAVLGRNFPMRNRIISGLALGVLIVEAARRSGSLITARIAAEQGRVVFALPGRVDSTLSQGANELIRDGAILVQNLDDVLEHLGQVGQDMTAEEELAGELPLPPGLDNTQTLLLGALDHNELSLDEMVRATEIPIGQAAAAMTMLVLGGFVEQRPGNVFARKKRGHQKK